MLDSIHYNDFESLYGTNTKESLPSSAESTKEDIPTGIINNNQIRQFINCTFCNKPRCIYSKNVLTKDEKLHLQLLLDSIIYCCGSPISTENHELHGKVFIRQKINCKSPIEASYFSCKRLTTEIICFYCGEKEGLLVPHEDLKKEYQTIYPFCEICKRKGYEWPTRGKVKVGQKGQKRKQIN